MPVKKLFRRMMQSAKNLKISPDTHQRLDIARAREGVKMYEYAEAALEVALRHKNEITQLLADRTKQAQGKAKPE